MNRYRWERLGMTAAAAGILVFGATGCGGGEPARESAADGTESGVLAVHVVNYPLQYFAERIGGERVRVTFPAPAAGDPAYWSPGADQVAGYQGADLVLLSGAGYAKWVARASLPLGKTVDTSAELADRLLPLEEAATHSHGPEGEHSHTGTAFTTWLDPELATEQSRAILTAFTRARPGDEAAFRAGFDALEADLRALDARMAASAAGLGREPLIFSHPVYQYLERRYGLNGRSVHWEPDENPDPGMWVDLERLRESHPARVMVWESAPLPEVSRRLEGLGMESVVFDPCGNRPGTGDYLSVMNANAERLEALARR